MRYLPAQMRVPPSFFCAWALGLAACAQALPAETPPAAGVLYFPGPFLPSPDGDATYVVSTNFDQRYDAGWLTRIDLTRLGAALEQAPSAAPQALAAALSRELFVPSLASEAQLSPNKTTAYLSHRGNGYVTVLDYQTGGAAPTFSCGDKGGAAALGGYLARTDCDAAHLFDLKQALAGREGLLHSAARENFDDASGLAFSPNGEAHVAFLADPRVAQLAVGPTPGSFLQSVRRGPLGSTFFSLATLDDGTLLGCGQRLGGSELGAQEALLSVWPPNAPLPYEFYPLRALSDGRALDRAPAAVLRAVASPPNDGRLFLLSRGPDALLALDPTPSTQSVADDAGFVQVQQSAVRWRLADAYALPNVVLTDALFVPREQGDLVVVTSLERDALYFFDVSGPRLRLVRRLRLADGRGPNRLWLAQTAQKPVLLVSTFFDHGLSAIDLSPSAPADFTAVSMHDALFENALARP